MNQESSRSHAVMIITIASPDCSSNNNSNLPTPPSNPTTNNPNTNTTNTNINRESVLMMVDLAGSERSSATTNTTNTRHSTIRSEEGIAINLSLSALGNCIAALASNNNNSNTNSNNSNNNNNNSVHIPFRDSKLTRLLQVKH